jgi:hypothetical protein
MSKNGRRKLREIVWPRWLTVTLIVAGVGLVVLFGIRSVRSLREVLYLQEQGLNDGTADVSAIRGWMTIRYISLAYAVPEEYVWEQLGLPPARDPHTTLEQLNRQYNFGRPTEGQPPAIVGLVQAIMTEYKENPVATGLDEVRPWMNLQYIANSTGTPVEELFAAVQIPLEDNAFVPLGTLAAEVDYPGGLRQLIDDIETFLASP